MNKSNGSDRTKYRKKPQQDRSVQRVEAILAAAGVLIARHGVSGLKMTEIAREAGIPIGSLYQYFPERVAVVKVLFDRVTAMVKAKTIETFTNIQSQEQALERICDIIDWYYEEFRGNPAYFEIWIGTESDRDLMHLNVADSADVGKLFHNSVRHLLPKDGSIDMDTRAFMFSYLIGSSVRLAVISEEKVARKVLTEWKAVIRTMVFAPQA